MKKRNFLIGLAAIPAALWPFKAEAMWPKTKKPSVDLLKQREANIRSMREKHIYDRLNPPNPTTKA